MTCSAEIYFASVIWFIWGTQLRFFLIYITSASSGVKSQFSGWWSHIGFQFFFSFWRNMRHLGYGPYPHESHFKLYATLSYWEKSQALPVSHHVEVGDHGREKPCYGSSGPSHRRVKTLPTNTRNSSYFAGSCNIVRSNAVRVSPSTITIVPWM
jgi:hypothetical protein